MNYAIILAAGVGQRMRSGGMPKQFLKLMGKPIIIYTLEKFEDCSDIDKIVVVCRGAYTELMEELIALYKLKKISKIVVGGKDRQNSLEIGLQAVYDDGAAADDIVVIHDGVRPLVLESTISENIRVSNEFGCAVTVHAVAETMLVTETMEAGIDCFKKRDDTYSLTSPQTFKVGVIKNAIAGYQKRDNEMPLLDAAMIYADMGGIVKLVKEQNNNLKVTTPEDFYYLKAMLEMEENRRVFGL